MSFAKAPSHPRGLLIIEGECARPKAFSYHDLASQHEDYQIPDASRIDQRLKGTAVRLRALIDEVGPDLGARWLTIESEDGRFSVSLPLRETRETALIVYAQGNQPLAREAGGPLRFVVPFHPDECTRVKGVRTLSLTAEKGRDTRPTTAAEHRAIHSPD